ncbi:MAG: hypothetical protein HXO49_03575 [Prevotella sp.]|nr:hypothetical protein [Prevotella sp.]
MGRELKIGFGALSGSIKEQVEAQGFGISEMAGEKFDNCSRAIMRLMFADILTEGEVDKARRRLMKQITECVEVTNE